MGSRHLYTLYLNSQIVCFLIYAQRGWEWRSFWAKPGDGRDARLCIRLWGEFDRGGPVECAELRDGRHGCGISWNYACTLNRYFFDCRDYRRIYLDGSFDARRFTFLFD